MNSLRKDWTKAVHVNKSNNSEIMKITIPTLFLAALLTGCATVSKEESAMADFGPYPVTYEFDIKNLESKQLLDPNSATYDFSEPRKGVWRQGLLAGGKKYYGWIVQVGINGKNLYGGYVGEHTYYFFFEGGLVRDITPQMGQMANYAPE
jgi:hypothetical protein